MQDSTEGLKPIHLSPGSEEQSRAKRMVTWKHGGNHEKAKGLTCFEKVIYNLYLLWSALTLGHI